MCTVLAPHYYRGRCTCPIVLPWSQLKTVVRTRPTAKPEAPVGWQGGGAGRERRWLRSRSAAGAHRPGYGRRSAARAGAGLAVQAARYAPRASGACWMILLDNRSLGIPCGKTNSQGLRIRLRPENSLTTTGSSWIILLDNRVHSALLATRGSIAATALLNC